MSERVTSGDGIEITYDASGHGSPTLVFVHGWSCDRSYWRGQFDFFAREHQVVAVDLPGHGESGADRGTWTVGAFGGDVAAAVQKLSLDDVILIGHSMGGDVVLEAARQLRGRVRALIWDFVSATRAFVRRLFLPGSDPLLVERVAADMSAAPIDVAVPSLEAAMHYSREVPNVLRELALPVVAINPDYKPTDEASLARMV